MIQVCTAALVTYDTPPAVAQAVFKDTTLTESSRASDAAQSEEPPLFIQQRLCCACSRQNKQKSCSWGSVHAPKS